MKYFFVIVVLFIGLTNCAFAQKNKKNSAADNAVLLNKAIFEKKDSLILEKLLGSEIIYGHSGGKAETRSEMINGVMANKSSYENVKTDITSIVEKGKVAVVRLVLSATEKDKDGKISTLKLGILQTWIKEKKEWKLIGRQAVKILS